jgi:hypothetical protein
MTVTEPVEVLPTLTVETLMSVLAAAFPWVMGLAVVTAICWWLVRLFSAGRS